MKKDYAKMYLSAGLPVIPAWRTDEGGYRFPLNWGQYRDGQTDADIDRLFEGDDAWGMAFLCTQANQVEVLDFDAKHDPTGKLMGEYFVALYADDIIRPHFSDLLVVQTKSGGAHFIYRTDKQEGSQKLARNAQGETVIETRGRGALVFCAPTPGYKLWEDNALQSYADVKHIPGAVRDRILEIARTFDAGPAEQEIQQAVSTYRPDREVRGEQPGAQFVRDTDLVGLLESYAWTVVSRHGDYVRLNRPDAKNSRGVDGVVIHRPEGDLFYPWSTSTPFHPEKTYNAFAVYAVMEHGGDYKAAASDLAQQGFGEQRPATLAGQVLQERKRPQDLEDKWQAIMAKVRDTAWSVQKGWTVPPDVVRLNFGAKTYAVSGAKMLGAVVGKQKAGKTIITQALMAAGKSRDGVRNPLLFENEIGGDYMYIDTEQSLGFYGYSMSLCHKMTGLSDRTNMPGVYAYNLRGLSSAQRIRAIDELIGRNELGILAIDGIRDLCRDINDWKETQEVMDMLQEWSERCGGLMICHLHTTKGHNDEVRGALGTELQNKADWMLEAKYNKNLEVFTMGSRENRYGRDRKSVV